MTDTRTPAELRDAAADKDREAYDSFERCDTDGFVTQWAHGLEAARLRLQASIEENDGRATFPALFDLDGELIPAKLVYGQFGASFGRLASDDPHGRFTGWANPSKAKTNARARDAAKGFYVGYVQAPAKAVLAGGNATCVNAIAVRTDGGFSRDVIVVDNGTDHNDARWYSV